MPKLTKEEDANRRLFVGKLHPETDDTALRNYFGQYGDILDYIIMRYPDTRRSKGFGFVTFNDPQSLTHALGSGPHFIDNCPVEIKAAVPRDELPSKPRSESRFGPGNMEGRLFVGQLNYDTNDTVLKSYFERYGELTDNIIMRYPDTKRSKGFGFVTFRNPNDVEKVLNSQPHIIDGKTVALQRATPKEADTLPFRGGSGRHGPPGADVETIDAEHKLMRKLFIGNLSYATSEDDLKQYFAKFGNLAECTLMKFNDTGRSRGFAFLTYEKAFMVDDCQQARPHELDGKVLEVKRAAPKANLRDPEALANVKKLWIGGVDENISDDDLQSYFSDFGQVLSIEQVKHHDTGKKRGFGFIEFNDHDPVDKIVLLGPHNIGGKRIDVKKALSKQEMAALKEQQGRNNSWGSLSEMQGGGMGGFNNQGGFSMANMGSPAAIMEMMMSSMKNMSGQSMGGNQRSSNSMSGSGRSSYGGGNSGYGNSSGGYGNSSGVYGTSGYGDDNDYSYSSGGGMSSRGYGGGGQDTMEKMIMEKMSSIYENMAAITNMTGIGGGGSGMGGGVGPMRGGSGYSARDSSGPYARTTDNSKKHYGW